MPSACAAASRSSSTCPISSTTCAAWSRTIFRPTPPSRPPACIVACRPPRSASSCLSAAATPTSSCLRCRPSPPSSPCWASGSAPWSRAGPKKSEGDRCHLSELDRGAPTGGPFRGDPPPLLRRQGPGPDRAVLARRQEPSGHSGGRPRLQAVGEVDPLRHLLTRSEEVELLFHRLEGDERFHRGSAGPVVAGESGPLSPDPQAVARPGQRAGEPQPPQPVHLSASAMGASDPTDVGAGLLSAVPQQV